MEEKTEMDRGMEQILYDKHPEILKTAHKYRIDENDPTWILVNLVVEGMGGIEKITETGTKALREASVASRELASREIVKLQEEAKTNIAKALGETLKNEIGKAVDRLKSQSNRPLHKKWGIAMGVAVLVALGLGGWGYHTTHKKWVREGLDLGFDKGVRAAVPAIETFNKIFNCSIPGYKASWSADGKKAFCEPGPDPETGKIHKLRVR